jgi:hypothetical protein
MVRVIVPPVLPLVGEILAMYGPLYANVTALLEEPPFVKTINCKLPTTLAGAKHVTDVAETVCASTTTDPKRHCVFVFTSTLASFVPVIVTFTLPEEGEDDGL